MPLSERKSKAAGVTSEIAQLPLLPLLRLLSPTFSGTHLDQQPKNLGSLWRLFGQNFQDERRSEDMDSG